MASPLLHTPANIIAEYFTVLGLATRPVEEGEWPAFVSTMPNSPDDCMCVYDTTGLSEQRAGKDFVAAHHYGIQVRVRSTDYEVGYLKAQGVQNALEAILREVVAFDPADYLVQAARVPTPASALGKEQDSERMLFTVNALVTLRILE